MAIASEMIGKLFDRSDSAMTVKQLDKWMVKRFPKGIGRRSERSKGNQTACGNALGGGRLPVHNAIKKNKVSVHLVKKIITYELELSGVVLPKRRPNFYQFLHNEACNDPFNLVESVERCKQEL